MGRSEIVERRDAELVGEMRISANGRSTAHCRWGLERKGEEREKGKKTRKERQRLCDTRRARGGESKDLLEMSAQVEVDHNGEAGNFFGACLGGMGPVDLGGWRGRQLTQATTQAATGETGQHQRVSPARQGYDRLTTPYVITPLYGVAASVLAGVSGVRGQTLSCFIISSEILFSLLLTQAMQLVGKQWLVADDWGWGLQV